MNNLYKIPKLVTSLEIIFILLAAALIEFRIEGILFQNIASAITVAILIIYSALKVKGDNPIKDAWQKYHGTKIFGCTVVGLLLLYQVANPDPSHAVLLKAQEAIVGGLNASITDPVLKPLAVNFLISIMWIGRAALLGIVIKMLFEANQQRDEGATFKDILMKPAIFVLSVGIANALGNYLATGAVA